MTPGDQPDAAARGAMAGAVWREDLAPPGIHHFVVTLSPSLDWNRSSPVLSLLLYQLHPTVLCPTFLGGVGGHGLRLSIACCCETGSVDAK